MTERMSPEEAGRRGGSVRATLRAEKKRLRAALVQIKAQSGAVCPTFEVCTHPWCEASCAAWMLADEALNAPREIREKAELGMTEMTHCTWCQPPTTHPANHPHSQPSQTVDDLRRENERLLAEIVAWDERYTGEGRARFECAEHVERLQAALAESERVSGERLGRIGELRDALIRIEADSRKLGVAPGQLGDAAGRALAGHKPPHA